MISCEEACEQWGWNLLTPTPNAIRPVAYVMMEALTEALSRDKFEESDDPMQTARNMSRFWIMVNSSDRVKKAVRDSRAAFIDRFEALHLAEYAYMAGYNAVLERHGIAYRQKNRAPSERMAQARSGTRVEEAA